MDATAFVPWAITSGQNKKPEPDHIPRWDHVGLWLSKHWPLSMSTVTLRLQFRN